MPSLKRSRRPAAPETTSPPGGPSQPGAGPGRQRPLLVNMPAGQVHEGAMPRPDQPDLRLPHERDQSAVDTTAADPSDVIVQAAKDLAAGLVDTDLHNQPGLDARQRRKLLKRQP